MTSRKDWPVRNKTKRIHNPLSDSYVTDNWIKDGLFGGWFDPCPYNPAWNKYQYQCGLEQSWADKTFVNPPFSDVMPWVDKAIREARKGNTIVMLLKHDASTKWYSKLHQAGCFVLPIQGRLKFNTPHGCAFPCALFILHNVAPDIYGTTLKDFEDDSDE